MSSAGRRSRRLLVIGAALLSAGAALVSTRHGIGANGTDSVAYLTMADDVAAGDMPYPTVIGVPPTHLPPGWSVLVGSVLAVVPGTDAFEAARAVNVLFAGLLPIAVHLACARGRSGSWAPPVLAVVIATSYPLFELASRAVVEPVFLVLLVAALHAVDRVSRERRDVAVVTAAVLVGALTLTRYVGAAALVPLLLAVIAGWSSWRDRLLRAGLAVAIALGPTLAWYLLEPGAPESQHLRGSSRAGVGEVLHSLREAGVTLVRGEYLPGIVQAVIGLGLVAAPVAAVVLTASACSPNEPWRRRSTRLVSTLGLAPWLWFLAGYTLIVAVQRWDIDREIISRYWLPYWVVTAIVLGRCLVELGTRVPAAVPRLIRPALVALLLVAGYNLAQVAVTARENARDGVTLNAVKYQRSVALDALAAAEVDLVHTDHVQLVELQLYAREALVPIERLSCRPGTAVQLAGELEAGAVRAGVAILRRCRSTELAEELVELADDLEAVPERGVGVVLVPRSAPQKPL